MPPKRPRLWGAYVDAHSVSLKDHFERLLAEAERLNLLRVRTLAAQIEAVDQLHQAKAEAAATAIRKAEQATTVRFEGVNEFRAQLADQAARFVARDVVEAKFEESLRRLNVLERTTPKPEYIDGKLGDTERRLNALEHINSRVEGRVWGISFAVGVVVTAINLGLRFLL